ncbi:MAG: hypothetical protein Q9220_005757 [cf. Caloplaca sp. 1 TL-2023]
MKGYCGNGYARARRDYENQKQMKEEQKALLREAPRPLPALRKRAVTIPLSPSNSESSQWFWQKGQKSNDQLQSSFFGELPLEVRELIYKHYVTSSAEHGGPVHIFRRNDRRLGHGRCTEGPESHSHMPNQDWGYDKPSRTRAWIKANNTSLKANCSLLSLLKTCRRAYSEAIPFLYTHNTFCFQDCMTLVYFTQTVLPQRLELVQSIQLPWTKTYLGFFNPGVDLEKIWEPMNKLTGLQEIRIVKLKSRSNSLNGWIYPAWTGWMTEVGRRTRARVLVGGQEVNQMPST